MNDLMIAESKDLAAVYGSCFACWITLLESGGFYGTGLCGPCCTGESATIGMLTSDDVERERNDVPMTGKPCKQAKK